MHLKTSYLPIVHIDSNTPEMKLRQLAGEKEKLFSLTMEIESPLICLSKISLHYDQVSFLLFYL